MLPCAHPSPNPKRHLDRSSRFCTAHGRASLYFTMGRSFPSKLPLPVGDLDPHLTRFFEPIRANNRNDISIGSVPFAQLNAECPCTLQYGPNMGPFPQNCPSYGDLPNTWFLGPPESSTQTASRSVQPFLQGS